MKAVGYSLFRYKLPLFQPLHLKGEVLHEREGILVRFEGETDGVEGWGDCAPLPGFSRESLAEAEEQLRAFLNEQSCWREEEIRGDGLLPSVHFGLEAAMVNLHAAGREIPLSKVFRMDPSMEIGVNALIDGDTDLAPNVPAVKVKVARRPLAEDVALLTEIRQRVGPDTPIIADANRGWTFEEASRFAEAVEALNLAYVEEPLKDPTRLADLGMPVALDESLLEGKMEEVCDAENMVCYVLKPTLLGGLETCLDWAFQAEERGLSVTFSACYESGVGIWALANMAAAYPASNRFAGLDTYSRLAGDVLSPSLDLASGRLAVNKPFAHFGAMDESTLECIAHG